MAVLTIPNTFVAGTPALASEVNANFSEIVSWSNDIGPDNFSSGWTEGISFAMPTGNAIEIVNNGNDEAIKVIQNGVLTTNKAAILINATGATQTATDAADFKIIASAGSTIPAFHVLHGAVATLKLTKSSLNLLGDTTLVYNTRIKVPVQTTAQRNALVSPETASLLYDSTTQQLNEKRSDGWAPVGPPVGSIQMFAGSSAPEGWVLCDGTTLDSVANPKYAALFAVISTTYGGTGAASFKVPDCRGVFVRGAGSQTIGAETYTATLGASQNDATAVNGLTNSSHKHNLPAKTRTQNGTFAAPYGGAGSVGVGYGEYWAADATILSNYQLSDSASVSLSGDTETRPANIALNYIIKY